MINSFSPNTRIRSSEENANWSNFSNHGRNVGVKWSYPGTVTVQNILDYISLPDSGTWERVDLIVDTAPTGTAIIVDIERSTDGGSTWTTIFTGGTNRPQIAVGSRTGSTTTIDVPAFTANSHLFRAKIAQIGSTIAGANLSIILKGKYNVD